MVATVRHDASKSIVLECSHIDQFLFQEWSSMKKQFLLLNGQHARYVMTA